MPTTRVRRAAHGWIAVALVALIVCQGGSSAAHAQGGIPCVGDCDGDGRVSVAELVTGVNIALGIRPVADCPEFDVTGNGRVTVDELIQGVNAALLGCTSNSATIARRAAGTIQVTDTSLEAVSNVMAVVLQAASALKKGQGAALVIPCAAGGQVAIDCTQTITPLPPPPTVGPPTYTITVSHCRAAADAGTAVTLNGAMALAGGESGLVCFTALPDASTLSVSSWVQLAEGPAGSVTVALSGVGGPLVLSGSVPGCGRDTVRAQLGGAMTMVDRDGDGVPLNTTTADLTDPILTMAVEQFGASADCAPVISRITLEGGATFVTGANAFAGTYEGYEVHEDRTSGTRLATLSGAIDSACFGARVEVATHNALVGGAGGACPRFGAVDVTHGAMIDRIRFDPDGGVEIDEGADGGVDDLFASCVDPPLFICPAP